MILNIFNSKTYLKKYIIIAKYYNNNLYNYVSDIYI